MSKWGGLSGALLGAGGATAYYNGLDASGFVGSWLTPSWGGSQRWAASGKSAELDDLYKLVERLSRDVHRNHGAGVTVIHGSNGSSAIFTYGGMVLVSTLGVMYIRGWKLTDLLYVTRASLQKSMSSVTTSVEGLTQRMNSVRQFVATQLDSVKKRQEDAMRAQEALKSQLQEVGMDVENTRGDVAGVHADLSRLGENMTALTDQQSYTSEGIYLLCSVVGDLMKTVNYDGRSTRELEKFVKRPASRPLGLEGILVAPDADGGQKPALQSGARRMAIAASADAADIDAICPDAERVGPDDRRAPRGMVPWLTRKMSSTV